MSDDDRYMVPVLMDSEEAARLLRVSVRTLEGWRYAGTGPRFVKFGRGKGANVMYRVTDLNDWLAEHTVETGEIKKK